VKEIKKKTKKDRYKDKKPIESGELVQKVYKQTMAVNSWVNLPKH
jgi:hypothetical protein